MVKTIMAISCVCCAISFVIFMILLGRKAPGKKIWGIITLITLAIFIYSGSLIPVKKDVEVKNSNTGSTIVDETVKVLETDGFIEKLIDLGLKEDEALGAREILIKCGIPSIENVEATDTNATVDGLISFREKIDDDRVFWFTIEKRKIFYVALNGEDLYDADKGGFLKKFEDVHIPDIKVSYEEYMKLQNLSEKLLDKYFGFDVRNYKAWGVGRSDNKYMTRCKASDGKILTNNWIYCYIWYEKQNEEFVPTDMKIDGKIVNVR